MELTPKTYKSKCHCRNLSLYRIRRLDKYIMQNPKVKIVFQSVVHNRRRQAVVLFEDGSSLVLTISCSFDPFCLFIKRQK